MSQFLHPTLSLLRTLLATTLTSGDEQAKSVAKYAHRMVTHLLVHSDTVPLLQTEAVTALDGLLDEILGELGDMDGSMMLKPQLLRHIRIKPDYVVAQPYLQDAVRLLAGKQGPTSKDLLKKIVAISLAMQQGYKRAIDAQEIKPSSTQTANDPLNDEQRVAFQSYLRKTFPEEKALEVGPAKSIGGGGSKLTHFVELRGAAQLPKNVAVRLDRYDGVGARSVVNEFPLLKALHRAGVLVPEAFACENGNSLFGAPFIVTSVMPGHMVGDWTDVMEPSRAFAVGLARNLAKLHAIPPEEAGKSMRGANVTARERVWQDMVSFENSWRISGEASVALELGYAWLKNHMDYADGRRAIIHCELSTPNMLGENGQFTALLDWEEASIGNPAQDLLYVRPLVLQMMPWEEFLAEYENAGGVIPGAREMDFYRLWREVFGLHFMMMARTFFGTEMSSSMVLGYVTHHIYQCYLNDLNESLQHVYTRD